MSQFLIKSTFLAVLAAGACPSAPALAEDSLVSLTAPVEGATLAAGKTYSAEYEVKAGTKAHHVHLFVDGAEVGTAHKLKGALSYGPLEPGSHKICVAPVNKGHAAIGTQVCAGVSAQ